MRTGKVLAVNVSAKRGTVKHPVEEIKLLFDYGAEGDSHAERGSKRQVSLLGKESVDKMSALGIKGLCFGKFAENITTEGITLHTLPVGTELKIGSAICEVSQIGKKCHAADGCEVAKLFGVCVMPKEGIFVRVLREGTVKAGDDVEVISLPQ